MSRRDRPERSAARIERDIETLAGPDYTRSSEAIRRYAYTPEYRNTLDYFTRRARSELGFDVSEDPVGTLVARNRPPGEPVFGIGSHCDSNRNGGKYDGTMGVVTALEVCRLNAELGLDLPLQLISFLEEEGSGFGQMLLGSRIMRAARDRGGAARALPRDRRRPQLLGARRGGRLRARALARVDPRPRRPDRLDRDAHRAGARAPGHRQPDRRSSTAIAGYVHADVVVARPRRPRRRDADGPPARPDARRSPRRSLELERLARAAGHGDGRHGRRDRGRPGADQRDRRAACASRSTSAAPTTTRFRGVARDDRRVRRGGRASGAA